MRADRSSTVRGMVLQTLNLVGEGIALHQSSVAGSHAPNTPRTFVLPPSKLLPTLVILWTVSLYPPLLILNSI